MVHNSGIEQILQLKTPTTFDEQIEILKNRNLIFEDDSFARDTLGQVNYYRLTAYLLPFKNFESDCYRPKTSFNQIYRLYEFDQKLKNIILYAIEPIEILLRTKIAYYHAHKYGAEGYTNPDNFDRMDRHSRFIEEFDGVVNKNGKKLFVKHHIDKYGRRFPIWVAVELFSFGMLSKFYANMKIVDQKHISKQFINIGPEHLKSWLICISDLRNRCAHYMRLYFHRLVFFPKLPHGTYSSNSERIFDIIYIMKYLYLDRNKWTRMVVRDLEALIQQYNKDIQLKYIGFPDNWQEVLAY